MPDNKNIPIILMLKLLEEPLTPEEEKELIEFEAIDNNKQVIEELTNADSLTQQLEMIETINNKKSDIKKNLEGMLFPPARKVRLNIWLKYTAAAVIILAAGIIIFRSYTTRTPNTGKTPGNNMEVNKVEGDDVDPGGKKAMLTLADNREIELDSTNKLNLVQGTTRLLQNDSQLIYQYTGVQKENLTLYNTLKTPPGGEYQLLLPDQSRVWLNAASLIKFPVVFNKKERRVEITGEVYFEVKENSRIPFIVDVKSKFGITELRVLGTHFNVMAYADEPSITTTVLEGRVKVQTQASNSHAVTLSRDESANIDSNKKVAVTRQVDVDKETAWKNDYFSFDKDSIETIMREIARWYNLEVTFEPNIPIREYSGNISRSMTLKQVLTALEFADIHFKITGNKILVTP